MTKLERHRKPNHKSRAVVFGAKAARAQVNEELQTLYSALDNVGNGLLVLNKDLRAVYSNPALHEMFRANSPEEIRSTQPLYADMLEHSARATAVDLKDYVAIRLTRVISGDTTPMDLPMSNGTVLRCQLAVLPGGGRMLIYSDVTDIVRNAEELERLATIDGMTGIYNRRHFMTLADREWQRSRRHNRPMAFLMIDIDYFKKVNDKFGHQIGDAMIVHLAGIARECKRESDVLARIGGEEFALLLPETDLHQAQGVAERLRREIVSNPLVAPSGSIGATVSIGVAVMAEAMNGVSDLMKAADHALYEAKRTGRNRVICAFQKSRIAV
ncbi:MAG: GGDEF domain-containing protein [Xanthobacteraceae bacterium]